MARRVSIGVIRVLFPVVIVIVVGVLVQLIIFFRQKPFTPEAR